MGITSFFSKDNSSVKFDQAYMNIVNEIDGGLNINSLDSVDVFGRIEANLRVLKQYEKCDKIQKILDEYSDNKDKKFFCDYILNFQKENCSE